MSQMRPSVHEPSKYSWERCIKTVPPCSRDLGYILCPRIKNYVELYPLTAATKELEQRMNAYLAATFVPGPLLTESLLDPHD